MSEILAATSHRSPAAIRDYLALTHEGTGSLIRVFLPMLPQVRKHPTGRWQPTSLAPAKAACRISRSHVGASMPSQPGKGNCFDIC